MTMLSSAASPSDTLSTHLPPGTADDAFNITVVSYVSDALGSTAVTSLGADRTPFVIVSTPPDEVRPYTNQRSPEQEFPYEVSPRLLQEQGIMRALS